MTQDLRRAAELLAVSEHADQFLAGLVWPVALRECPGDPWGWIIEQARIGSGVSPCRMKLLFGSSNQESALVCDQELAARLLLCRVPRDAVDIARIEQATGARNLRRLLAACAASSP